MKLIPNCSEAVFRLDATNLSAKERKIVIEIFNEDAKNKEDESEDFDVYLYESKIFDKEVLTYDGEYPYHCSSRIDDSMEKAEKKIGKKLKYEIEQE